MNNLKKQLGFTRAETVITLAILVALGGVLYFAIQPETSRADGRDATRRSEVVSVLNAMLKYQVDHDGQLPAGIDSDASTAQVLGLSFSGCSSTCLAVATTDSCLDLSPSLLGQYMDEIPFDPKSGDANNTGYYVNLSGDRLIVGACEPEESNSIFVAR